MSIVCAVIKNNAIAIACDTQVSQGSLNVGSKYLTQASKLYLVGDNIIGLVGWGAMADSLEHLMQKDPELFDFSDRFEGYSSLLKIHKKLKKGYFLQTSEGDDEQPLESSQFDVLLINKEGLYEIGSLREYNQFSRFWAVGSGRSYALGAIFSHYDSDLSALELVEIGVKAACEFNDSCSLPLFSEVLEIPS